MAHPRWWRRRARSGSLPDAGGAFSDITVSDAPAEGPSDAPVSSVIGAALARPLHGSRSRLAPHPPTPPAPNHSRAGRNLYLAVPTALIALAIVAMSVFFDTRIFAIITLVAVAIGIWEAAGAFLNRGVRIPWVISILGGMSVAAAGWVGGLGWAFVALIGAGLVVATDVSLQRPILRPIDASAGIFAMAWIGLLGACAGQMGRMENVPAHVALLVLMPVANDVGGWGAGILFGKHKMAPRISPGKSWEGFAGSAALALAVSSVLSHVFLGYSWLLTLVVAVAAVVTSTAGDLSESLLKRDLGVKDMGSIFPGHGGMLDRLDSILMWAPMCYLLAVYGAQLL